MIYPDNGPDKKKLMSTNHNNNKKLTIVHFLSRLFPGIFFRVIHFWYFSVYVIGIFFDYPAKKKQRQIFNCEILFFHWNILFFSISSQIEVIVIIFTEFLGLFHHWMIIFTFTYSYLFVCYFNIIFTSRLYVRVCV